MQVKKYNTNHERMPGFLERIRTLTREYGNILTVAEVGGADSLPVMRDYTRGDDRLATAYGFDLLNAPSPNAEVFRRALAAWPNATGEGWPSWAFSNHDVARVATRWGDDTDPERRARLFALLLVSLRGNLFVYQGEELGLPQAAVPFEALQDPEAIAHWPHSLGRDGARTPMPWRHDTPNAGFSDAEPWLPVDAGQQRLAVDRQETNPDSTLNFFRNVLRLRENSAALRHGDLEFLDAPADVLAFVRNSAGERLLCVFNLGGAQVAWAPAVGGSARLEAAVGVEGSRIPPMLDGFAGYLALLAPGPAT
jgi:alpha-glucosidase